MDFHGTRDVLDVRDATTANSRFDDANLSNMVLSDVNMSNVRIENAQVAGMTIDGFAIADLLHAYEAAAAAGGE